jgi:succinate dehydrogenase / fumarate reductase cytochrome b subunit
MVGNLQVFQGAEKLNAYADFLHSMGGFLWVFRLVMAFAIILHIISATLVTLQNIQARPQRYKVQRYRTSTYAARTMWIGGPLIACFVIYHLLHLTVGSVHPGFTENVYNNVVFGFRVWWISLFYIAIMAVLGLHLFHGLSSMFKSVGAVHPKWKGWMQAFAVAFSLAIAVGNISIPVSVLIGIVNPV